MVSQRYRAQCYLILTYVGYKGLPEESHVCTPVQGITNIVEIFVLVNTMRVVSWYSQSGYKGFAPKLFRGTTNNECSHVDII